MAARESPMGTDMGATGFGRWMTNWLSVRSVAVLLAVAVVAAACGGGTGSGSRHTAGGNFTVPAVLRSVFNTTMKASTASIVEQVTISGSSSTLPIGAGSVDIAHGLMSYTSSASPSSSSSVTTATTVGTPSTVYTSIPAGYVPPKQTKPLISLLGGKQWEEYTAITGAGGIQGDATFFDAEIYNPLWLIACLAGASGPVKYLGNATVGSVSTRHYNFKVDFAKAASNSTNIKRGLGSIFADEALFLGVASVPAQIWVDQQGRVVQFELTVTFPSSKPESTSGRRASATVTLDLSGFGTPVSVTLPASSTVADQQEVAAALGGLSTTGATGSSPTSSTSSTSIGTSSSPGGTS
jgi:hypothetical protein